MAWEQGCITMTVLIVASLMSGYAAQMLEGQCLE